MKDKNLRTVTAVIKASLIFVALLFLGATAKAAPSYQLQGLSRGTTNWINGNLQFWRELDYIPCRVYITGGPVTNRIIRVNFPHLTGTTPGFENLINFTATSNAVITAGPVLTAPAGADWYYTFSVTVFDGNPAAVNFSARLAAGAHLNSGSSLALSGNPSSMGTLQIHKPSAGPGAPDLVIVKTGPVTAQPGQIITYSLFYTNIATATPATGVQISDILPPELTVIPASLINAQLIGNSIFWDLGTVVPGQKGQVSFQAQITPSAVNGQVIQNYSQILSAEDDVNYANNSSTWNTTINVLCSPATIAGQPLSQEICLGQSVTLAVAANGSTPLSYQWRKESVSLPGETNSTLNLPSVTMADLGGYEVIVINSCGSATSVVAIVSIYAPITATPLTSQTNCPGATVSFNTTVSATLPVGYEWLKDGVLIPGQLMNSLTVSNITATDAGLYTVVVSGGCYLITNSATLTVPAAPTILCASNKTVEAGSVWTFDEPTINSGTPTILSTTTNTGCGSTLTATRTWQVADSCGNAAQCSQTVTVVDTTAPVLTCAATKSVECGSPFSFDAPTASDGNVTVVSTVTNASGCTYSATRTWVATDDCGNSAQCSQMITVVDTTAPAITCAAGKSMEAGSAFSFDLPTVLDGCSTNSVAVVSTVTNSASCGFSVTRTWAATDACGNSAPCSQTISVVDTTAPSITCAANKSVESGSAFNFDQPTATDVGGTNSISIVSTVTNAVGCSYSVTRTWAATDACGNSAQCGQTISVVDTAAPSITCGANKNVEAGSAFSFDQPTATDVGGTNTIIIVSTGTNAVGCSYSVTRTWAATDACGNSAQCSQTISVVDTIAPSITCVANKSVEAGSGFGFDQPTATDLGGTNSISIVGTVTNAAGCGYSVLRTWRATDACGNAAQCSQTISVTDTTAPAITCAANKLVEAGAAFSFDQPTATDVGSTNSINIVSTVTNAASCGYNVVRTWRAMDACGNTAQCSQTINVVDTIAPAITCATNKSVEAGNVFGFDQPTATDIGGTNAISIVSTVTNTVSCSYNVVRTWRATDACGNAAQCSQTISVVDTTAPTITCVANKTVACGDAWTFDVPTVSGGSLSTFTTVTNAACGNTFNATRTWAATDACGNTAQCSQTVTLLDTTAPVITCATNKSVIYNAVWSFDAPTATDGCGTNSVTVLSTTTNATCGANYVATRTWRATDACGNTAQCSQSVTVIDDRTPVLNCVPDKAVPCGSIWAFDLPAVSQGSITNFTTVTNLACGNTLTATRTWTAVDSCGNTKQCSQTVTVADATAPVVTCVANKSVEAGSAFSFDQPTALDTCGTNSVSIVSTVTNAVGCSYNVTRTWAATDACGNTAQCSQTISVLDSTAPSITCVANKSVEAGSAFSFDQPTATDVGGTNSISILSTVTNMVSCSYNVVRTWRATDACGNSAQCSQTINVVDSTAPSITCAANKSVEAGNAFGFDQPTATDLGSTNSISIVSTVTNAASCGYSVVRTWRATDACGNTAQCSQTISVADTTAPAITCVANKSVEAGSTFSFDQPTATDVGSTNAISIVSTVTNAAGCGYNVIRTWRATDACGNSAQCSQTISVVDSTAPTITCAANKAVEAGNAFGFDQPTATDVGSTNSISIVSTVTNAASCGYNVVRMWAATDACGNTAQCSQTINVVDTTAPSITCVANKSVEAGAAFSFDQPTANEGSITIVSTVTNSAGCSYSVTRTWAAADTCGNTAQCSQVITVVDTTAPTIAIIVPTNSATYITPATITFTADAFDASGPVDKVEFYIGANKVGETFEAPYSITLSNLTPGVYSVLAATVDACGNATASAAVAVNVLEKPPLTVVAAMHFNPQTGLFEQTVRVFNPTGSEFAAVRVYVNNLPGNVTVYNQTATTNGVPYVQSGTRVLPGSYMDLLIEYYVPSRVAPTPTLVAELVPLGGGIGTVLGNGQIIERGVMLPNSTFLLEFSTVTSRTYYVQYSSDLENWLTAQQPITGNGSRVQWIDNGQPKTLSAPGSESQRFYRLIVVP